MRGFKSHCRTVPEAADFPNLAENAGPFSLPNSQAGLKRLGVQTAIAI
jgi:hypothetical protein